MKHPRPLRDGGPAFPLTIVNGQSEIVYPGMTVRDWFAGKALSGLSALQLDQLGADDIAQMAYQQADAMLVAQEKRGAHSLLIEAAPDMLDALETLENDKGFIPSFAWTLIKNAIAKARGKKEVSRG